MSKPKFTKARRQELIRVHGLREEQIAELESSALPMLVRLLRPLPPLTEVKRTLRIFLKAANQLSRAAELMSKAPNGSSAREAYDRLCESTRLISFVGHTGIDDLVAEVMIAEAAADHAIARAKSPRRLKSAARIPIQFIYQALQDGFGRHLQSLPAPKRAQARFHPEPSSSPKSPFREVVGICFEAVGEPTEAERAIRLFLKRLERVKRKRGTTSSKKS